MLQLYHEATGERVSNVHAAALSSEAATVLFEPRASGSTTSETYLLYYLPYRRSACETGPSRACPTPYRLTAGSSSCAADYGSRVGSPACCGQQGRVDREEAICPREAPRCHGYVWGSAWGECIPDAMAAAAASTSSAMWLRRVHALLGSYREWKPRTPRAKLVGIHARTERDAFWPMEVPASAAEAAWLRSNVSHRALLVWPEARTRPIRMSHALPLKWLVDGTHAPNASSIAGHAQRGEYFTFQVGAYAAASAALRLSPRWVGALRGEHCKGCTISAARLRCVNAPLNSAATREGISLGSGEVLPLWFGIEVPRDATPDTYTGVVRLGAVAAADGTVLPGEEVAVRVSVSDELAEQSGDSELWRHSRLRWLDSTVGQAEPSQHSAEDAAAVGARVGWAPGSSSLTCDGARTFQLSPFGMPAALSVGRTQLLAAAARMRILPSRGRELRLEAQTGAAAMQLTRDAGGGVKWRAQSIAQANGSSRKQQVCADIRVAVSGELSTDGLAQMRAELTLPSSPPSADGSANRAAAAAACDLRDVQLQLPLLASAVPMINGFDVKGAPRPDDVQWRWDSEKPDPDHAQRGLNCRVWLGSATAGVQLNLQGTEQAESAAASHCGNDENGQLQCESLSDAQFNVALGSKEWFNRNRGGASVVTKPAGAGDSGTQEAVSMVTVYTGALELTPGRTLKLAWRLLLTPVRGAGEALHADFATRYFHMQRFASVKQAMEATEEPWIILHQGNQLIPYINYPFLQLDPLRQYIRKAHAKGAKVKLYYTVRELSTAATELWALRALRGEVVISSKGKAAGHAWLREHLRANYTAAWHEVLADGEVDAAVQTPAFTSRYDNFWIEGILWLVRNLQIDGIYLDGAPYERSILRRLRRALAAEGVRRADFLLDLHASCAGNPHLPYVELYPYLDSLWFGEECIYRSYSPTQWLAEVSGVPFGLQGQVLGTNSDQWQGLLFGMTCRIYPDPDRCNPRPLWAALDAMDMRRPRLLGWWDPACPIAVEDAPTITYNQPSGSGPAVVASVFVSSWPGRVAIALANWADREVTVRLRLDAHLLQQAVGVSSSGASSSRRSSSSGLRAVEIAGFQPAGTWSVGEPLTLRAKGSGYNEGWLLELA